MGQMVIHNGRQYKLKDAVRLGLVHAEKVKDEKPKTPPRDKARKAPRPVSTR